MAGQEAVRAVDKRAGELPLEHLTKTRNTDRNFCGTAPGDTGPVETKLGSMGAVKGIVMGATGEGSEAPTRRRSTPSSTTSPSPG